MKKILLLICVLTLSLAVNAQQGEKSGLLKIGGQSEWDRFGLGLEGRYMVTDNFRLAPDAILFFSNHDVWGFNIGANAHYVFSVADKVNAYPLTGFTILNNRFAGTSGNTDLGFNIGAGADFNISDKSFLNADLKYTFTDHDFFSLFVGYGIKF